MTATKNPAPAGTRASKGKAHQLAISPIRMSRFLQAIAGGNYIQTSCKYAGITPPTYRNWVALGERELERVRLETPEGGEDAEDQVLGWLEEHPTNGARGAYAADAPALTAPGPAAFSPLYWPCVVFSFLLEKAEAEAEVNAVTQIQLAAKRPNHWQAAMTFLERRHPERWARRDRLALEGGGPGSSPIELSGLPSTDVLIERIEALAAATASKAPAATEETQ